MTLRKFTFLLLAVATIIVTSPAWASDICETAPGNLVLNCGFETGDFTYWTLTGNTGFTGVTLGQYVYSGTYGAFLGAFGSDTYLTNDSSLYGNTLTFVASNSSGYWGLDSVIVQDLGFIGPTTNLYYIQFALMNDTAGTNDFTVLWDGADVGPGLVNSNEFPYTIYSGYLEGPSVPEPGTLMLMGTGLLGLAAVVRRRIGL